MRLRQQGITPSLALPTRGREQFPLLQAAISFLIAIGSCTPFTANAAKPDAPAYILSLSWSPAYCAQSHHDNSTECRSSRAFILHGLWPQGGDPSNCDRQTRVPDNIVQHMTPIMGSRSLVIHEWHKHGACSGESPQDYFKTIEAAWSRVKIPQQYAIPTGSFTTSDNRLRQDFAQANASLAPADITPTCHAGVLQEVRICLDDRLNPSACAARRASCTGSIIVPAPAR